MTSLVLGSLGFLLTSNLGRGDSSFWFTFQASFTAASFFSWPCLLLLWWEVYLVERSTWQVPVKKLVTSVVCLMLACAALEAFMSLFALKWDRELFQNFSGYILALLFGVWVWRWPGRQKGEESSPATG
jgi:hypothetical protein